MITCNFCAFEAKFAHLSDGHIVKYCDYCLKKAFLPAHVKIDKFPIPKPDDLDVDR